MLTNDGDLSRYFEHPSSEVTRTYRVTVTGIVRLLLSVFLTRSKVDPIALDGLKEGITVKGISYGSIVVKIEPEKEKDKEKGAQTLTIKLKEGKNREIRKVLAHLGLRVCNEPEKTASYASDTPKAYPKNLLRAIQSKRTRTDLF